MDKHLRKKLVVSSLMFLFVLPIISSAILIPPQPNQGALIIPVFLNVILTIVWWIFIAGAVISFVLIAVLFLSSQGNPEAVATARKAVIWGTAGVLVGILAFSILYIIGAAFSFF